MLAAMARIYMEEQRLSIAQLLLLADPHEQGMHNPMQSKLWLVNCRLLSSLTSLLGAAQVGLSVCNMTTITGLSLVHCNLSAIDPAISQLANLVSLNISQNLFYPEMCLHLSPVSQRFTGRKVDLRVVMGCMQVPLELASLTTLTKLSLLWNGKRRAPGLERVQRGQDGSVLVPKMRVTEQGCRFLLHFPVLAALLLSVTRKEEAALAEFLADPQMGRNGPCNVTLVPCSHMFREDICFHLR